jgi:hypothetical protein
MKPSMLANASCLLVLLGFASGTVCGQRSATPRHARPPRQPMSVQSYLSIGGSKYFLKMIPLDAGNCDHMPMVNPNRQATPQWRDGGIHNPQDSTRRQGQSAPFGSSPR